MKRPFQILARSLSLDSGETQHEFALRIDPPDASIHSASLTAWQKEFAPLQKSLGYRSHENWENSQDNWESCDANSDMSGRNSDLSEELSGILETARVIVSGGLD